MVTGGCAKPTSARRARILSHRGNSGICRGNSVYRRGNSTTVPAVNSGQPAAHHRAKRSAARPGPPPRIPPNPTDRPQAAPHPAATQTASARSWPPDRAQVGAWIDCGRSVTLHAQDPKSQPAWSAPARPSSRRSSRTSPAMRAEPGLPPFSTLRVRSCAHRAAPAPRCTRIPRGPRVQRVTVAARCTWRRSCDSARLQANEADAPWPFPLTPTATNSNGAESRPLQSVASKRTPPSAI
jgi:hypothetical protein